MKKTLLVLLTLLSIRSVHCESLEPLDLGFLASQTNVTEIILYPEVDNFFNNGSNDYVKSIVNAKNCYLTSKGIRIGNANAGGELSFTLKPAYSKSISRIFLQCIVPGDVAPTVSVNGISKVIDAPANTIVWRYFDVEIAESAEQVISLSSSSKLILDVISIIYSGSKAAEGNVESIVVPVGKRTMNIGEDSMIYPIVSPSYALNKSLSYSSSDQNVVTVDKNGLIHANKLGNAIITIASVSTPAVSTSISVDVVEVKPTAINFVGTDKKIGVGGTLKLQLQFTPENAVKDVDWSTEWSEYIDLDQNGVIRAKKAINAANVKVTSKVDSSVNRYYAFTIVENLPVSSISVSPKELEMEVGDKFKAQAMVSPEGTSFPNVSWDSSNPNIAKVDSEGVVTALSFGQCEIYAIAGEKNKEIRAPINVRVIEFELSSIEPIKTVGNIILFQLNGRELIIKGYKPGESLQIFDLSGHCITSVKLNGSETTIALPIRKFLIVKIGDSIYKIY